MVITIAGGGSTFTAGIVKSIALRREELEVDEIRLFDINKERQDKVAVVVDWVLHKELNTDIKLVVTTDVQQAYTDTSFVFAQMRVGGYAMREQDEKIPLRHGCVGQETCGCGKHWHCTSERQTIFCKDNINFKFARSVFEKQETGQRLFP